MISSATKNWVFDIKNDNCGGKKWGKVVNNKIKNP